MHNKVEQRTVTTTAVETLFILMWYLPFIIAIVLLMFMAVFGIIGLMIAIILVPYTGAQIIRNVFGDPACYRDEIFYTKQQKKE